LGWPSSCASFATSSARPSFCWKAGPLGTPGSTEFQLNLQISYYLCAVVGAPPPPHHQHILHCRSKPPSVHAVFFFYREKYLIRSDTCVSCIMQGLPSAYFTTGRSRSRTEVKIPARCCLLSCDQNSGVYKIKANFCRSEAMSVAGRLGPEGAGGGAPHGTDHRLLGVFIYIYFL